MTLLEKHTKAIDRLKIRLFATKSPEQYGLYAEAWLSPMQIEFPHPQEYLGGLRYLIVQPREFNLAVQIEHKGGRLFSLVVFRETGDYQSSHTMLAAIFDVNELPQALERFIELAKAQAGVKPHRI